MSSAFICEKTSQSKIAELKMLNVFCLKNEENCGEKVVTTLGEVCDFNIGSARSTSQKDYYENVIAGILSKNNNLLDSKYLYHYLTINNYSESCCGILGNGLLNKTILGEILITIPSLNKQKEIVAYCDPNDSLIKQLENTIELNKTQAHQFLKGIVKTQEQHDNPDEVLDDEEQELEQEDDTDDEDAYNKLMEEYKKNDEDKKRRGRKTRQR
jgi:hypothetical protein